MAFGIVNVGTPQEEGTNHLTSDQVGVPGGLATLNGEGKLTESQIPDFGAYTKQQTDDKIAEAVSAHAANDAAHPDIRKEIAAVQASVQAVELKYGTDVTENAFTVSFANLNDVSVTGVWNADQGRIEF